MRVRSPALPGSDGEAEAAAEVGGDVEVLAVEENAGGVFENATGADGILAEGELDLALGGLGDAGGGVGRRGSGWRVAR